MRKRMTGVFCALILLMTFSIFQIYYVNMSDSLAMAADVQSSHDLPVAKTRGTIYDRNLEPLVNRSNKYIASVMPTPQAASALLPLTEEEKRPALLERLSSGKPFTMEVPTNDLYAQGVDVFRVAQRYAVDKNSQLAPHIIGYMGDGGRTGLAGIEKAFDERLEALGGTITTKYQVDALGRLMQGGTLSIDRSGENATGGIVLTLDSRMQSIAQNALQRGTSQGAAVVLDIYTGDILAMASAPDFDQNNIAQSLEQEDAPFINRAISGYNIGSVFKVIVSAAALENNIPTSFAHECKGEIDIGGQVFRCNNNAVHGYVDMQRALEVSCNTYFINLALKLGPGYLPALAQHMGIGTSAELAPGLSTQSGNLPSTQELQNPAALANFGFGQGSSLATPLQMAQAVATIANSGMAVTPRLVMGETLDGEEISSPSPGYVPTQILREETASSLCQMMISVIEKGSGRRAKPISGGAGGKTSSAQTGSYKGEREIVHAWFAGFFPAEHPKYSVVVFAEGGESGENVAGPIFKQIVDGIGGLR